PGIGPVGTLRRPPHGVQLAAIAGHAVAGRHLPEHLLGHVAGALTQLLQSAGLLVRAPAEVAVAQRALGAIPGPFPAAPLSRRLQPDLLELPLQAAQPLAQLALAVAEAALPFLDALALLARLALRAALAVSLALLLAKGIVEQLLLLADD